MKSARTTKAGNDMTDTMTDTEIRIAIAKLLGWKVTFTDGLPKTVCPFELINPGGSRAGYAFDEQTLWQYASPDYSNDLNAMHSAEEWLLNERPYDWMKYCKTVCSDFEPDAIAIHATARQRAQAFVHTLRTWKD